MVIKPVDVQIFGRSIKVNCPSEQHDALNDAVENLNQRLNELKMRSNVTNLEQLVCIVALNLCHELSKEKIKTHHFALNAEKSIRKLQVTIEEALIEQKNIAEFQGINFK